MSSDSIYLVEHQNIWAQNAAREIACLVQVLPLNLVLQMEHVGSTAIPGIKAKPVLDINLLVRSIQDAQVAIEPLKRIGYQFWKENPDQKKMFFVKGMPPLGTGRTHHIWIFEDPLDFENRFLFRNYLRANPKATREYESLKVGLAKTSSEDREAYTNAKSNFVDAIVRKARS
jgi:GrpB-like predicted nucleotidyltransferase (UPF0157 family)